MPKNSVLGKPSHVAKLSKRGFNLSQDLKFTSSVGQLLPVYYDFLNIGESVQLSSFVLTKTQPLETAAMVDIDEYVEWFFVPMNKILSTWNELYAGIDDFNSVVLAQQTYGGSLFPFTTCEVLQNQADDSFKNLMQLGYAAKSVYGARYDSLWSGFTRLADLLGYPLVSLTNGVYYVDTSGDEPTTVHHELYQESADYDFHINLATLMAYQAIYFDYYRLSSWEKNKIAAYNFDGIYPSNTAHSMALENNTAYTSNSDVSRDNLKQLLSLRYRPYQRDFYHAIEPSPLINTMGVLSGYFGQLGVSNPNSFGSNVDVESANGPLPNNQSGLSAGLQDSDLSVVSAANIRSVFAVDKMMRITGMSGKHYDDQMLAHFGVKPPQGIARECYFIGRQHQVLNVKEVVSAADTDGASLGQLGGRGVGYTNKENKFKFTAPCHGILMAIYSAVPRIDYCLMYDYFHTIDNRYDLYQPELDNLGMQPFFQSNCQLSGAVGDDIVAWRPRYMGFKSKPNRATYAFCDDLDSFYNHTSGSFRHWSISILPNRGYEFNDVNYFLCSPLDLNSIMLMSYVTNTYMDDLWGNEDLWTNLYAYDPLIHSCRFEVFKTSPMSTFGIEEL